MLTQRRYRRRYNDTEGNEVIPMIITWKGLESREPREEGSEKEEADQKQVKHQETRGRETDTETETEAISLSSFSLLFSLHHFLSLFLSLPPPALSLYFPRVLRSIVMSMMTSLVLLRYAPWISLEWRPTTRTRREGRWERENRGRRRDSEHQWFFDWSHDQCSFSLLVLSLLHLHWSLCQLLSLHTFSFFIIHSQRKTALLVVVRASKKRENIMTLSGLIFSWDPHATLLLTRIRSPSTENHPEAYYHQDDDYFLQAD